MPAADVPIIDNWTSFSFKRAMGSKTTPGVSWVAPTWADEHKRRLLAYTMLQAYYDNAARIFFESDTSVEEKEQHREYGDAITLRDTILAALLGEDQAILVDGADRDPDAIVTETDADGNESQVPTEDAEEIRAAITLQEWLTDWGQNLERLGLKMIETERNAVGLGDGVYVLGYSPTKKRVRLRVYDPGFYFPVLEDGNEDDFPTRVHLAWDVDDPATVPAGVRRVRRITWELVPLTDPRVIGPDANPRRVAYQDDLVEVTCLMTDATWTLPITGTNSPDDFTGGEADYATYVNDRGEEVPWKDVDQRIDFIPVVHLPNSVSILNHYGKASVERVLQILDDLANADTDLQGASATTGKPPVWLSGVTGAQKPTWRPGDLWSLGENGSAGMVDTSKALDALISYVKFLLGRLEVNSRVPASVVGREAGSNAQESGYHRALSFGPLRQMIHEMRLVRDEKYPLLLRMLWRMSKQNDVEGTPDKWIPARVEMGSFLPTDIAAIVEQVKTLLAAKAISRRTAVTMLIAAGFDILDAEAELDAIASTDFEGAKALADAVGQEGPAADYLQLELEEVPPPVTPPPGAPPIEPPVPPEPEPAGAGNNGR